MQRKGSSSAISVMTQLSHSKPVKLKDFRKHLEILMADSALRLSQEYEQLNTRSPSHPCTVAKEPENRSKNRYGDILPFDHSRVKVFPLADKKDSDYINASYIPGCIHLREYIASQGPLPETVNDFWRMIWEHEIAVIVMLTECVENGKTKCEAYWPPEHHTKDYRDVKVETRRESILSEFTIRIFDVSLCNYSRVIAQLHFTSWPDFGVPQNTALLINFVRAVRDHVTKDLVNPILVHCSAGVGRTGTFIALDRTMQHIITNDYVDLFRFVIEMREHRPGMVITLDQYRYLYQCVSDVIEEMLSSDTEQR